MHPQVGWLDRGGGRAQVPRPAWFAQQRLPSSQAALAQVLARSAKGRRSLQNMPISPRAEDDRPCPSPGPGPLTPWGRPGKRGCPLRVITGPRGLPCAAPACRTCPRGTCPGRRLCSRRPPDVSPGDGRHLLRHALLTKCRQKAGVQLLRVRKRNNLVSKSGLGTQGRIPEGLWGVCSCKRGDGLGPPLGDPGGSPLLWPLVLKARRTSHLKIRILCRPVNPQKHTAFH